MKSRAGFALAAAILVMVLIAVLVTGALFATNQETQATASEILDEQASAYAERAALLTIADWQCPECDALPVGGVLIRSPAADPPLESTVYLTRVDGTHFLVTAEGRIASTSAIRIKRRVTIAVKTSRDAAGTFRALRVREQAWSAAY